MTALLREVLEMTIQGRTINGKKNVTSEAWHRFIMQLLNSIDLYGKSCKLSLTRSVQLPASNGHKINKNGEWRLCTISKEIKKEVPLFTVSEGNSRRTWKWSTMLVIDQSQRKISENQGSGPCLITYGGLPLTCTNLTSKFQIPEWWSAPTWWARDRREHAAVVSSERAEKQC